MERVQILQNFTLKSKRVSLEETAFLKSLGFKWCPVCKSAKNINSFYKSNTKDGLDSSCKNCKEEYRNKNRIILNEKANQYYLNNKDIICEKASNYRMINQERVKNSKKNYYNLNKEVISEKNKKYRLENLEKIKVQQKEYYENNIEQKREQIRKYHKKNSKILSEKRRIRYNNDPLFRMKRICREMVKRMFKSVGINKCGKTSEILGYTPNDLKEHIENKFEEGMNWNNYGEWHIDHVIPISSASNLRDGIKLSQLDNLQPLWAEDNLRKSNKINYGEDIREKKN